MRIRALALATAAVAAAAVGIAPAASATTSAGYPYTLTAGTATATGTAQYINVNGTQKDMLVTGTITNTGSGCYEILPTNYLGGFFLTSYNGGGICGPGSVNVNYTLPGTFEGLLYICQVSSIPKDKYTNNCIEGGAGAGPFRVG
ncbi:hypothetical protein ACFYNO_37215 [Kitasatospora sp. NPDC006697]|uniref:hypothetical protein n=1 Tax=Kitasatospora sp. NPDC006697 TaxID=3364020 RepID=UPI003685B4B4